MAKYDPLRDHLTGLPNGQSEVTLGFDQINDILHAKLPDSVHKYREFCYGLAKANPSHMQKRAWDSAGWAVRTVQLASKQATFERVKR